ncbi:response regulator [Oceanicoccus sagamiensis]|uniref:Two-component system response regulator n=1 Tax=Oceanicoccus sagamiensis TaxID=716816 RepID=A0A1X9NIK0_9GAMM|nr:response regulator [Oceanicoccus sagamiensis]ARN75329.1 two-component system response regulator [Oceanicoccus sagamiensis]
MAKILLVEDNEMNRDMLSRRLKRRDYDVITADNGGTAVEKAINEQPDLILMDMELPVKDGWTASREVKQQQSTPIIALTAHALSGDKEKAMAAGCDDYATKPIDFPGLIAIIEKHLAK